MERWLDFVYLLFFGSHIPITMFADSQALLPRWLYPQSCIDVMNWFTTEYRDSMMGGKPAWFQSFIFSEIFMQFPFFFVAFYAYWKGVSKCQWIRLPMVVYSSHVVTSLICIYFHIFRHDFSKDELPGPRNTIERLQLAAFYFPYLIVPLILLIDCLVSPIYTLNPLDKSNNESRARPRTYAKKQK